MSSLARKSMNFIRDVYTLAADPDRASNSSAPLHNFQPSTGLSSQFTQDSQSYVNPPSPYLQPSSSQGHSLAPNLPTISTPYLSPFSDPQQPHGPWPAASTPLVPPPSRQQLNATSSASYPGTTSPDSSRPFSPPSPLSAPTSPQSYRFHPTNGQYQQPPERPPLPERPPFTSSRPHSQSFSSRAPHAESQSFTPETLVVAPSFTPVHPSSIPPLTNGCHSQNDHSPRPAELWSPPPRPSPPPPRPPPLPRRPQTQPPSSVSRMSTAPPPSNLQQQANANLPTLAVSAPISTTISYKAPSVPFHSSAYIPQIQQENDLHSPLELHSEYVPRPPEHTTQSFDSSVYPQTHGPAIDMFELVGSPVSLSTPQSESSAEQIVSATVSHPGYDSAASPLRQSESPQVAGHHSPCIHHNFNSAVSPPRQVAIPQAALYQSPTTQYYSGLTASLPAQMVSTPVAAQYPLSVQHTPSDVHEMPAAVDVLDPRRTISWSSSSVPTSELP